MSEEIIASTNQLYSHTTDKLTGVKCNQTVRLRNKFVTEKFSYKIRRIRYYDNETEKTFVFITNNFELPVTDIAKLYKYRWKIELFFKWIKLHLKIKSFWSHSINAVKTQVYVVLITYVLVAIIKHKRKHKQSQYEILQILSISLPCKVPLNQLFNKPDLQYFKELDSKSERLSDVVEKMAFEIVRLREEIQNIR